MKARAPSAAGNARKRLGSEGEERTAVFLEGLGYHMVDANVRPLGGRRRGEIDLVAWHEDCLCFIEVKTRRAYGTSIPSPAEAVNRKKRRQLVLLARAYLNLYALQDVPCRFDVVEIVRRQGGSQVPPAVTGWDGPDTNCEDLRFTLIENAFDANDAGGPDPLRW